MVDERLWKKMLVALVMPLGVTGIFLMRLKLIGDRRLLMTICSDESNGLS